MRMKVNENESECESKWAEMTQKRQFDKTLVMQIIGLPRGELFLPVPLLGVGVESGGCGIMHASYPLSWHAAIGGPLE